MEKNKIELDLEPVIDSIKKIANKNIQTLEKIEKGIKVDYCDLFILEHSTLAFSLLNNRYRNWRDKKGKE